MYYSANQSDVTKAIAKLNTKNFHHLNLITLNSSTIISTVAIYINVPTDMLIKTPLLKGPLDAINHPIAIPTGFIIAYITIIIVAIFLSTPAYLNANPKVKPSA